jgi:hypothetical protein
MSSLKLPPLFDQELFVSFYIPSSNLYVTPHKLEGSPSFVPLFKTTVRIEVPPGTQKPLARAVNAHFEEMLAKARADFAATMRELEEARSKFLALEN